MFSRGYQMNKLKHKALALLGKGRSPRSVSMAIAAGITLGIFPIYGPITLLCLMVAWLTRLNAPMMIAGLYTMTFVKPLLILPYLRLGEFLFRADPMPISLVELSRRFSESALGTLQEFGWSFAYATFGWLVTVPLLIAIFYSVSLALINRMNPPRIPSGDLPGSPTERPLKRSDPDLPRTGVSDTSTFGQNAPAG